MSRVGQLAEKVALVTGGASGIGAATARLFDEEGAHVVLADVDEEKGQATAEALGNGLFLEHDVTDEASWKNVMAAIGARYGRLDVVVNNAGVLPAALRLEDTSAEEWRRVTAVNLDGVFFGLKHGIRAMKAAGGAIVNVSSVRALVGAPIAGAYSSAKGGVLSLTKSAAIECAYLKYGIRVNAVCPGYIETEMLDRLANEFGGDRARRRFSRFAPLERMGRPEEVAAGILYLASDAASFVTGTELVIDGGYTAR